MGITTYFVGLSYFFSDSAGRIALLPDGTNVAGIAPHHAGLFIAREQLEDAGNWPVTEHDELTLAFMIDEPSTVTISSVDARPDPATSAFYKLKGTKGRRPRRLDTTHHDGRLPRLGAAGLKGIDPATAETIAQVPIRNGVLDALEIPSPDPHGAIVTRLTVYDHFGPILITATPKSGASPRTFAVKDNTEIVLANLSDDLVGGNTDESGHYQIFRKLVPGETALLDEPQIPASVPLLRSTHPFFIPVFGNFPSGKCSNTCC
jgi:hypothetical protein